MRKYRQKITSPIYGDCFRACMATLLQLPPEVLPNDFSASWHSNWQHYLNQFGLALSPSSNNKQPIWYSSPWIASVKSLNFDGELHAILVHNGSEVLHDPSNRKRYKAGTRISSDEVVTGQHLVVDDILLLERLSDYRRMLEPVPNSKAKVKEE